ncbi:forkhead box protein N3-like isoform X2 [Ctenocephalides felis]|uniref:forkhead box protein N3-like isoform X2 n=1 Tax=Ctenocephalides felis TaxID=7515 RepID=UPI000E6E156E|nr:forkhead box protein N3-like isoform X2 [Ctenocephalides felis]
MAARSAPSSPVSTTQNHQQLYQYQIASPDGIRIHLQDSSDQEEYNGVETREVRVETSPDDDLTSLSWLHDRNLLKEINLTSTPTTRTVILHQNVTHSTRTFQHHNSMNSNNGDASSTGESPTSDFEDNSYISEDNTRNSSDHSIIAGNNNSSNSKNHNLDNIYEYQQKQFHRNNGNSNSDYSSSNQHSPIRTIKPSPTKNKHPSSLPYDPLVHTTSKPPYSFSSLIFMAIEDSQAKALPVKEIYMWIVSHFPYFRDAPTGWKNSVRHNLSLNKCFQKLEKAPNLGKGSLWMVDERFRPNLLQALTRSPFHPCSALENINSNPQHTSSNGIGTATNGNTRLTSTTVVSNGKHSNNSLTNGSPVKDGKSLSHMPNPDLFPYLSRRLAAADQPNEDNQPNNSTHYNNSSQSQRQHTEYNHDKREMWTSEEFEEANAAAVMVALKHGRLGLPGAVPIITSSPSEDHTYSSVGLASTPQKQHTAALNSPDAAYETDDSQSQPTSFTDLEEQRRLAEGADALLNLAGIRRLSTPENALSVISYTTNYVHQNNNGQEYQQNAQNHESKYNKPQYQESRESRNSNSTRTKFKPRLLRRPKRRISAADSGDGKYYNSSKNLSNKFYEAKRIKVEKY